MCGRPGGAGWATPSPPVPSGQPGGREGGSCGVAVPLAPRRPDAVAPGHPRPAATRAPHPPPAIRVPPDARVPRAALASLVMSRR